MRTTLKRRKSIYSWTSEVSNISIFERSEVTQKWITCFKSKKAQNYSSEARERDLPPRRYHQNTRTFNTLLKAQRQNINKKVLWRQKNRGMKCIPLKIRGKQNEIKGKGPFAWNDYCTFRGWGLYPTSNSHAKTFSKGWKQQNSRWHSVHVWNKPPKKAWIRDDMETYTKPKEFISV